MKKSLQPDVDRSKQGSSGAPARERQRSKSPRPRDKHGTNGPTPGGGQGGTHTPGGGARSDDHHAVEVKILQPSPSVTSNGGLSSSLSEPPLAGADDTDVTDGGAGATDSPERQAAVRKLNAKIQKLMEMIREEQQQKEENVNEYLRQSIEVGDDRLARMKSQFEKRNQKSSQTIGQLHRKMETYRKRRGELEHGVGSPGGGAGGGGGGAGGAAGSGASGSGGGHRPAKEVLRDVGHGLRGVGTNIKDGITGFSGGVVDNLRGAKESIVAKPKDFVQLIKNKFGSADNISMIKTGDDETSVDGDQQNNGHGASHTLPAGFKYQSDEELSSLTSGSGNRSAPAAAPLSTETPPGGGGGPGAAAPLVDLAPVLRELQQAHERHTQLQRVIDTVKSQLMSEHSRNKQLLDDERFRSERLEEQINDLIDLHQHEITNIKQELTSMEEKMEYQLEERTRDMQDALETCQTRITKMELQQQQQQLVSMEGFDTTTFQALPTKLINVVLAVLALVLICVSTIANLVSPFLTSRLRILSTICIVTTVAVAWQNAELLKPVVRDLIRFVRPSDSSDSSDSSYSSDSPDSSVPYSKDADT